MRFQKGRSSVWLLLVISGSLHFLAQILYFCEQTSTNLGAWLLTKKPTTERVAEVAPLPAIWHIRGDELLLVVDGQPKPLTASEIYSLVFEGERQFRAVPIVLEPPPEGMTFSRYPAELTATIAYSELEPGSGLACQLTAKCGNAATPLRSLQQRQVDHIVINGRWFPFAAGARDEILSAFASVGVSDVGPLTLRQYLALRNKVGSFSWLIDGTAHRIIHPGTHAPASNEPSPTFNGNLYPFQKKGWQWLSFIWREGLGAILADEMGLGKTIQIIALLTRPERPLVAPSLIIAPGTLLENWRREIAKFAPSLRTYIHQGARRTGDYRILLGYDVIITSYDTVIRDSGMFQMVNWPIVVVDEAQAIRNPETRRAISIKALKRRVAIAVTGTPVENRLRDLWSIVDFCIPGYLGDEGSFEKKFSEDRTGASALEPLVSPIMLRRKVSEVAQDLPSRIEIPQVLTLSELEGTDYERVRTETINQYGASATLVALARLRMFCAHPMLLDTDLWSIDQAMQFAKFQRLFEIVDEVFTNRQKILVFTSYNRIAEFIVHTVRERYGLFADVINGDTPIIERQSVVDRLTSERAGGLLALNPKAAGTGLNITAATHVVHYNLEWNPAVEDQASARAHRRGQSQPVTIHRLYYADSVEEVVNDRLNRKRKLAEAAVVGIEGADEDYVDIARALQASPVKRAPAS